jgi:hypothetical protein
MESFTLVVATFPGKAPVMIFFDFPKNHLTGR